MVGHTRSVLGLALEVGGLTISAIAADRVRSVTGNNLLAFSTLAGGALLTGCGAVAFRRRDKANDQHRIGDGSATLGR